MFMHLKRERASQISRTRYDTSRERYRHVPHQRHRKKIRLLRSSQAPSLLVFPPLGVLIWEMDAKMPPLEVRERSFC